MRYFSRNYKMNAKIHHFSVRLYVQSVSQKMQPTQKFAAKKKYKLQRLATLQVWCWRSVEHNTIQTQFGIDKQRTVLFGKVINVQYAIFQKRGHFYC